MTDLYFFKHCPNCGGKWAEDKLPKQKATGIIVCGQCGVSWNDDLPLIESLMKERNEALVRAEKAESEVERWKRAIKILIEYLSMEASDDELKRRLG